MDASCVRVTICLSQPTGKWMFRSRHHLTEAHGINLSGLARQVLGATPVVLQPMSANFNL